MRLMITGGCGFLGSNLASHALKCGNQLLVFDNLYRKGSSENLQWLKSQGSFDFSHGDIRNSNDVSEVIKTFNPDAIIHLAGQVAMTTSISNPRMDFEINALGTFNLLEAVRLYAPDTAVIYSSTNKVIGDLEQYRYIETETRYKCLDYPDGFDESIPLAFHSPYGCSKGAADQYMLDYSRMFSLKTVVFRHSSMYGGRQFSTQDQGWIGWFCQKAIERKNGSTQPFDIYGNGKQVRDVLHVEDIMKLYFSALNSIDLIKGESFYVGGGMRNSLSLLELFGVLENMTEVKLNYVKNAPRQSDQKVFVANNSKITTALGWKPRVDYQKGIESMIDWISGIYGEAR